MLKILPWPVEAFGMAWHRVAVLLQPAADSPRSAAGQLRAGQVLLLVSGLITSSTLLALHPSGSAVLTLLGVSAVLLTFVVASSWVPWSKLPPRSIAARWGGEEFLPLLVGASPEVALDVLARMRSRWTETHPTITFSAGIAAINTPDAVPTAIADADSALYRAKEAGRNCDLICYADVLRLP